MGDVSWKNMGTRYPAGGGRVVVETFEGVVRVRVDELMETGTNRQEALERLADKLERLAKELRK